jgi:hypothetical protein
MHFRLIDLARIHLDDILNFLEVLELLLTLGLSEFHHFNLANLNRIMQCSHAYFLISVALILA